MAMIITPKEGEKVLFTIRKNFVTLFKPLLKFILFFGVGVMSFFLIKNEIANLVSLLLVFFALCYAFYHFIIWFYDVYIVTNLRVICVNQKSLFSKEFSELDYANIRDVTYAIKGVVATIFRLGTVTIKTSDGSMELNGLSYPDEVQEMIKGLSEKFRKTSYDNISAQELVEMILKSHKK